MTIIKERVRLLVDALRSGEYRQGTGALQRGGKFCCLGVACEVALKNGLIVLRDPGDDDDGNGVEYSCPTDGDIPDSSQGELPRGVVEWFGFDSVDPSLMIPFEHTHNADEMLASELNDTYLFDFEQIAQCFEYTYLGGRNKWQ